MSNPEIRSILVAVDFSDAAARAVGAAGLLASKCGATLTLLHAEPVEAPLYFTHEQVEALERQSEQHRAQCTAFLGRFGRQHTSAPFSTMLDGRAPADAILDRAAAADVVVMGTHGRRGPSRWWLGSVAERVLRHIDRPLLIVKATDRVDQLLDRVLVHAAAPLTGDATLAWARALAARTGSAVVDGRFVPIEASVARHAATMLVTAAPVPHHHAWLANIGEPLVRFATIPTLFVPEPAGAAAGAAVARETRAQGEKV